MYFQFWWENKRETSNQKINLTKIIQRANRMGKPKGWFWRVLSVALTLYPAKVVGSDVRDPESAISETKASDSLDDTKPQVINCITQRHVCKIWWVLLSANCLLKIDCEIEDDRISYKPFIKHTRECEMNMSHISYYEGLFFNAFSQMLGVLFPAKDHTWGRSYRYFYHEKNSQLQGNSSSKRRSYPCILVLTWIKILCRQ